MEDKIIECKKILSKARTGSVIYLSDLAGDIMQEVIDNYYLPKLDSIDASILTLEDCFLLYHSKHIACECDCDNERIYFVEEY
jgi:hypothetical protein